MNDFDQGYRDGRDLADVRRSVEARVMQFLIAELPGARKVADVRIMANEITYAIMLNRVANNKPAYRLMYDESAKAKGYPHD